MERRKTIKRISDDRIEIVSRGIYENGEIKLLGKQLPKKKMNVVVSFREEKVNEEYNKTKALNNFVKKWSGAIKEKDIDFVMEKKFEYLVEKHK